MSPKLIAITNRSLCREDLPTRITRLCEAGFDHIIMREKDLSLDEYALLLEAIGRTVPTHFWQRILLHSYTPSELLATHRNLEAFLAAVGGFQLTASQVASGAAQTLTDFDRAHPLIGTTAHTIEETHLAQANQMTYVIASHIYSTACKPGLAPHGLKLLDAVAQLIDPSDTELWALGGITPKCAPEVTAHKAQGLCIMSSAMTEDPDMLMRAFCAALRQV